MPRLFLGICSEFSHSLLLKCHSIGIWTVSDFIVNDPEELAAKAGISYKDALSIHHALLLKYASFPQNAQSLYHESLESISILNTGSKRINKLLNGGIYSGEITEIHGKPGSGKTQFCLSVISNMMLNSKNTALYFNTNCNFTSSRVEQILMSQSNDNQENIFFKFLKVLVVDSITCLISPCIGGKYLDGLGLMCNIVQQLQVLCSDYKISVLISNNTVGCKNSKIKPALGKTWQYAPTVSLFMDKTEDIFKIRTIKSCHTETSKEVTFNINEAGIAD